MPLTLGKLIKTIFLSTSDKSNPGLPFGEFVTLMALLTSITALTIDAILPALPDVGRDLQVAHSNDVQLIISLIFLGMGLGQLFYGPLSDSIGRKPAVAIGIGVFAVGCLFSLLAADFNTMLLGRLLQGIGLGAPRIVSMALIRDQYQGRAMARVMSFVMTIFILVPMVAPALGQGILLFANWRMIFATILVFGIVVLVWFLVRQPETLAPERRFPFSLRQMGRSVREIIGNRVAFGYTLTAGVVFSAFLAYLSSVQQLLQQQYALGNMFALAFAGLALSVGGASYVNGRLVVHFGMQFMLRRSLIVLFVVSTIFYGVSFRYGGQPPLWMLAPYLMVILFCMGLLFGNINALAMEPLGHIAGIGAAVVGSMSTLVAIPVGIVIARAYDGTVLPIVGSFAVCALLALAISTWAEAGKRERTL